MRPIVITIIFLLTNYFQSMAQNESDGYTLQKVELSKLLSDESKKRCKALENELELEEDVQIYTFDTKKYLVHFVDENAGVLYDSKEELIATAKQPDEELVYEKWIKDMNLSLEDVIDEEEKDYPMLSNKIGLKNISVNDTNKVEEFMLQGGFMNYNAELYKEMLIYTLDVIVKQGEDFDVILEPNQVGDLEIFIEKENKLSNLCMFVWNSVLEPFEGYFSQTKSFP